MIPSLWMLLHAALCVALLLGMTDAAAQALGGGSVQRMAALGVLFLALARGATRNRRRGAVLLHALWIGAAGLLLPRVAHLTAPFFAGGERSGTTWLGALTLALVAGLPMGHFGAALAARLASASSTPWNALLLGGAMGAAGVAALGLGTVGYLAVVAVLALLSLAAPEASPVAATAADGASAPKGSPASRAESAAMRAAGRSALGLVPVAACGVAAAFGLLFLLPLLEVFDGSAATEVEGRWLAVGAALWASAVTLGTSLAGTRLAAWAAALLALAASYGLVRAADGLQTLMEPALFDALVTIPPIVDTMASADRLQEGDFFYVPVLTLAVGLLALVAFGSLLRVIVDLPGRRGVGRGPFASLGVLLAAVGASLLVAVFGHPWVSEQRGAIAFLATLGAGGSTLIWLAAKRALVLRAVAAAGLVAVPAAFFGLPGDPVTSFPFRDNFLWQAAEHVQGDSVTFGQRRTLDSLARVLTRDASTSLGKNFLAEGRNLLTATPDRWPGLRAEAAFPLAFAGERGRGLLVGTPEAEVIGDLKRRHGVGSVHLAVDPPELVAVAEEFHPSWPLSRPDAVFSTVAAAESDYPYILIRDEAWWDRNRNSLRPSLLRTAASKLANDGVLAVALDPERCLPDLPGAVARVLGSILPVVELWLLPQGWRPPRLLVTGRRTDAAPRLDASLAEALRSDGVPVFDASDLPILRIAGPEHLDRLGRFPLDEPLPRGAARLADVAARQIEEVRTWHRAGSVLQALAEHLGDEADNGLLPFYATHLSGQIYATQDTYVLAPEHEWIDVERKSLDLLLDLSRRHPDSDTLRQLWADLGPVLVQKREVEWCLQYYTALTSSEEVMVGDAKVPGLGWRSPAFDLVLGNASLEMLDPEAALRYADQVLAAREGDSAARMLRAAAYTAAERHAEAAAEYAAMVAERPATGVELLRLWADAELAAGNEDKARELAVDILDRFGDEALGSKLGALLGLEPSFEAHVPGGLDTKPQD